MSIRSALVAALVAAGASALAAEAPVSPFGPRRAERTDAVEGRLVLSDGKVHQGRLYLTRDKRLEVFDTARKKWFKLKLKDVARISFAVESEAVEKEWRWKEGGSDVKVYTGRTYVDRKYTVTVKLREDETLTGHIRGAPVYIEDEEGRKYRYMLRKDQRGKWDQKPEEIVYVREIILGAREKTGGAGAGGG